MAEYIYWIGYITYANVEWKHAIILDTTLHYYGDGGDVDTTTTITHIAFYI
jgi:hypothetical protein